MHPTLFDSAWLGLDGDLRFTLSSYFLAIVLGFLGAAFLGYREAMRMGWDRQKFIDFAIWMLIAGVLGSRLMHVFVDGLFWDYVHVCLDPFAMEGRGLPESAACFSNAECLDAQAAGRDIGGVCRAEDGLCYPQRDCLRWLKFWAGGLTVYGGLIACVITAVVLCRRYGFPLRKMLDLGGYGIFFGLFVGRLGCLGAGCCFGATCDIEWLSVQFPEGSPAYHRHFEDYFAELNAQYQSGARGSLPIYPTQLISSTYNFLIFVIAYFIIRPRKRFDGQVLLVSALLYTLCRFGIEFVRDDFRGGFAGLSTSQWVSLPIAAICIALLFMGLKKARAHRSPLKLETQSSDKK